ncbi:MAG: peptigoglycan-binding protein LysM, partial [Mesorhizobium sp.]
MAINPVKALLFAVGGSVAAAGTAYVSGALDPYLNRAPAEVASLTPPMEKPAEPGTDGPPPPAPATDAMAPAASATADAIAPTFDIVRVEIKGS